MPSVWFRSEAKIRALLSEVHAIPEFQSSDRVRCLGVCHARTCEIADVNGALTEMPEERKALAVSGGAEVVHLGTSPVRQSFGLSQHLTGVFVDWRHPQVEVIGCPAPAEIEPGVRRATNKHPPPKRT